MRRLRVLRTSLAALSALSAALSIVVGLAAAPRLAAQDLTPPTATIKPKIDTLHGEIRTDNYFWLREKSNPEVISYLEKENAYTTARMKHTEALQQKLYDEMLGRIKETDVSVPFRENGYLYWTATEKGKSYPIFMRRKATGGAPDEVVIDANALAVGKKFSQVGGLQVSPGASQSSDVQVFHESDVLDNVGVGRSKSGKFIMISDDGFTSSESRVIPTANPFRAPIVVAPRKTNVEY